jgi:hypothetical protein
MERKDRKDRRAAHSCPLSRDQRPASPAAAGTKSAVANTSEELSRLHSRRAFRSLCSLRELVAPET